MKDSSMKAYKTIMLQQEDIWRCNCKERRGEYLGGTVQVTPHITNEIKDRVYAVSKEKMLM